MRLLIANITAYPHIGGIETSLRFIARALRRLGHEPKIFCLRGSPQESAGDWHEGVEIIRAERLRSPSPRQHYRYMAQAAARGIAELSDRWTPDIVWSRSAPVAIGIRQGGYTGPMLQIFPTMSRMNSRGLYLSTQGLPLLKRAILMAMWPTGNRSLFTIERDLLGQCTPVVFSDLMRQQMLKAYGHRADAVRVLRPGVDDETFSAEHGSHQLEQVRALLGLDPQVQVILYVGRLAVSKNVPLLIQALGHIAPPAKLVLVGGGPDQAYLRQYVTARGLDDRVIFAGPQTDLLPGFYSLARVSVLPTTAESFGQVYLESLACGTPAVGFAGDGNRVLTATSEIIRDGENGFAVRKVSPAGLADAVTAVLDMPAQDYDRMSACALQTASAYSWDRFVAQALELGQIPEQV
jgi:1,2-diacylglycerol 3-alpha-glucosyltransferase